MVGDCPIGDATGDGDADPLGATAAGEGDGEPTITGVGEEEGLCGTSPPPPAPPGVCQTRMAVSAR